MARISVMSRRQPRRRRAWLLALAALAGLGLIMRFLLAPAPEAPLAQAQAAEPGAMPEHERRQQETAAEAALSGAGEPPVQGPVTQRPDYVSEVEWDVLRGLAQQHADPERELARLVNSLRFNKQLETWRAGHGATTPERRALAEALLAALPERVRQQEYSVTDAERLQRELIAALAPDTKARAQREELERQRLPRAGALERFSK